MDVSSKRCAICGRTQPLTRFGSKGKDRKPREICNDCRAARERDKRRGLPPKPRVVDPLFSTCAQCGVLKPITDFPAAPYGRHVQACHACTFPAAPWPEQRECLRCHQVKPISEFSRSKRTPKSWCKECGRIRKAEWHTQNRKHVADYARRRFITHHDAILEMNMRRHARKKNAPIIEKVDRTAIIARDNGTCYMCGCKPTGFNLTLDHIIPLARGGSHTADNLRVACRPCNSRKGARL